LLLLLLRLLLRHAARRVEAQLLLQQIVQVHCNRTFYNSVKPLEARLRAETGLTGWTPRKVVAAPCAQARLNEKLQVFISRGQHQDGALSVGFRRLVHCLVVWF
jgi:hypothetical protein